DRSGREPLGGHRSRIPRRKGAVAPERSNDGLASVERVVQTASRLVLMRKTRRCVRLVFDVGTLVGQEVAAFRTASHQPPKQSKVAIDWPPGIRKPLVVVGVVPSTAMVPPPSACMTAWLQPAGTVSYATAATDTPRWCEVNLPHGSTLTSSVCEPSALG